MGPLLILVGVFVLMWALVILPQQRQVKHHKAVVGRLQVGDEVMTTAGLYGTVTDLDDEVVSLEVAPGTVLRIARGAVGRRLVEEQAPEPAPEVPAGTAADRAVAVDAPDAPDAPDATADEPEPAPDAAPAEP
jgi:preprotein translocase subunit YajC